NDAPGPYHRNWAPACAGATNNRCRGDEQILQSTFAPEALMILAYFGISLLISAENCSGVVGAGSAPCCAMHAFISGVPRIRVISAFHLAMMSFGVPAGAMNPHQV